MDNTPTETTLSLVAKIVRNYVAHHQLAPEGLSSLIASVHQAFQHLGRTEQPAEARTPAVPVRHSVQRDYVVCLECGFRGQAIRSHLRRMHRLTREEYRARWNLPREHPLVAPAYSERRSAMARQTGLGRRGQRRR